MEKILCTKLFSFEKKLKKILFAFVLFMSFDAQAVNQNCGVVNIEEMISGPRHGAMMRVSDASCGNNGWLCLDPNAEYMSARASDRLYSLVLAQKMANRQIQVTAYENVYAVACHGPYPVVEDVRTR